MVSFQSVHTHSQPVVVLERLATKKKNPPLNNFDEASSIITESICSSRQPSLVSEYLPPSRIKLIHNSTMCLRSQTRVPSKQFKKIYPSKKKLRVGLRKDSRPPLESRRTRNLESQQLNKNIHLHEKKKHRVHTHSQPVVVLERLAPKKIIPPQNNFDEASSIITESICSSRQPSLVSEYLPSSRIKLIRNSTMYLRSDSRPPLESRRTKNLESPCYTSDIDDERLLKYFKTTYQQKAKEVKSPIREPVVRVTRSSLDNNQHQGKRTSTDKPVAERTESMISCTGFKEPYLPSRFCIGMTSKSGMSNISETLQPEKEDQSAKNNTEANPDEPVVEPAPEPTVGPAEPSEPAEPVDSEVATSELNMSSEQDPLFYGDKGIVRWLNGNSGANNSKDLVEITPPITSKKSAICVPSPVRVSSPCLSERLKTVRDVATASRAILERRCKACDGCRRINKVQRITSLRQGDESPVSNLNAGVRKDIYEFNAEVDDSSTPLPYYVNRKNKNNTSQDVTTPEALNRSSTPSLPAATEISSSSSEAAPSRSPTPKNHEPRVSLDLHIKDTPQVLNITQVQFPNKVIRARLAPLSEVKDAFSLIDNKPTLEQILTTSGLNGNGSSKNQTEAADRRAAKRTIKRTNENPNARVSETIASPQPPTATSTRKKRQRVVNDHVQYTTSRSQNSTAAKMVEAPVFYMTDDDFNDPVTFFEKIAPTASKFGLCKVVAPESFKPHNVLNDAIKFNVANHYITRLYSRWGPAAREISAMKAYLASQNVNFSRVPLLDKLEVNLPKLYLVVQRNGGLKKVMDKKRWGRVAEEMGFKGPNIDKILENYYVKYLLPYDTASNQGRMQKMAAVEKGWNKKHRKLLELALNPLHHQKKQLGESDSSDDDEMSDETDAIDKALQEAEDCIVNGRPMSLSGFKKVANLAMQLYNPNGADAKDIEKEYWRLVLLGTEHICVNAASIDTATSGYGFTKVKTNPFGKHPWNLKLLRSNSGNLLRSLGSVLGVTDPTLHLGMVYSTSCWHRDPHALPWMEYMHEGPSKIWYGIPDEQSAKFRQAVETLSPTSVQNKSIWLSSDITMIPPDLLLEKNVPLSHAVQNPGEFIIVFPKAYSCSISTGFTVSESVYFATYSWLQGVHEVFQELRDSCEPTTFSLEHLLISLATDPRSSLAVLQQVHSSLSTIVNQELHHRRALRQLNLPDRLRLKERKRRNAWTPRSEMECQICRTTFHLSKVTGVLGKKSCVCLLHALRLLENPKHKKNVSKTEVVIFFSEKELEELMTKLQTRLSP